MKASTKTSKAKTVSSEVAANGGPINVKDRKTFETIYDSYIGLLRFIARECAVPVGERDELVQDSFLKLLECKAETEFKDLQSVKGFLVVTLRHLIIDRSRRLKSRKTEAVGADLNDLSYTEIQGHHEWNSQQYERAVSTVGQLVQKIGALPGSQAFELFYCGGLSVKEISAKTGEPVGSVTAKLCRIRQKNSEMMRKHVEESIGV